MKKIISALLVLAMLPTLAACGASPALKDARSKIAAIGEVDLDSGEAIAAAEESVMALDEEEREKLDSSALSAAREDYDALVLEAKRAETAEKLAGEWVQVGGEYLGESYTLSADGTLTAALFPEGGAQGSWTVSDDASAVVLSLGGGDKTLEIGQKDGAPFLSFGEAMFCPLDDLDAGRGETIRITLTPQNMADYLDEPAYIGELLHVRAYRSEYLTVGYHFPSRLYERGYTFLESTEPYDLRYTTRYVGDAPGRTPFYCGVFAMLEHSTDLDGKAENYPVREFSGGSCELRFARSEYVREVNLTAPLSGFYQREDHEANEEFSFDLVRTVVLDDGSEHESLFFTYTAAEPFFGDEDAAALYAKAAY